MSQSLNRFPVLLFQRTPQPSRLGVRVYCKKNESPLVRIAVSAATQVLRLVGGSTRKPPVNTFVESPRNFQPEEILKVIKSDYERSYFLTGEFTSTIYTEDCLFADPTIEFKGKETYRTNLKLLVPFYEDPVLTLKTIEQLREEGGDVIVASWHLRTYLKLPWRPLISFDGSTRYELDSSCQIQSHVESWSISPLQAIRLLFTASEEDSVGICQFCGNRRE